MLPKRENETTEFKKSLSELKEGVISIASMLNKSGEAHLYFGIKNDGTVFGQEIGESSTKKLANEIKSFIKPIVIPKIETVEVDGKTVIEVTAQANDCPYSAYGRYYKRLDDQDLEMPQGDLEKAFLNKNPTYSAWENELTPYGESFVDEVELINYVNEANEANRLDYRYRDVTDCLTRLGLMVNGRLNNAGLYLFGNNRPLIIKLAIFATDERLAFLDHRHFEGNILECINEALKYIASNLRFHAEIVGFQRIEKPEIPLEAIREVVINSFAHMRVMPGAYNEITITPKRIRIYNPGLIARSEDPKNFAKGSIGSMARNPLIATTLYRNKTIEAFGTGFRRVFSLCDTHRVAYDYGTDGVGFYFEFLRGGNPGESEIQNAVSIQKETEGKKEESLAQGNEANDRINDTIKALDVIKDAISRIDTINDIRNDTITKGDIRKNLPDFHLSQTERNLLRCMRQRGGYLYNTMDAVEELGKSRITIQRAIQSLVEKGKAKRVGSNKTGCWILIDEE